MDDLVTWLRGVLDEDDRAARDADEAGRREGLRPARWMRDHSTVMAGPVHLVQPNSHFDPGSVAEHIARHDPASVLADIAAKRTILDAATRQVGTREAPPLFPHLLVDDCWYSCPKSSEGCCDEGAGDGCNCGADWRREHLVRLLASAYRHRRGYRDEWAPTTG